MRKNLLTVMLVVVAVLAMTLFLVACPPPEAEPTIETVKTPVITPDGGEFVGDASVDISSATAGATIRYTTDGTDPTATSSIFVKGTTKITCAFSEAGTVVKAKAFKDGMDPSSVVTSKGFISIEPGLYLRGSMNGWGMGDRAKYKFAYSSTTEEFKFSVNGDLTGDQAFKIVGGFVGWNDNASLCPTAKDAAVVKAGDDDATADLQWSLPKDSTYGVYPTAGVGKPIDVAVKGGGQNFVYSAGTGAVYDIIVSKLELDSATGLLAGLNGAPAYDANITLAQARFESTNIGTFPPPYFNALKWAFKGTIVSGDVDNFASVDMELAADAGSIWDLTSDLVAATEFNLIIAVSDWSKRWGGTKTYGFGEVIPAENAITLDTTSDMFFQTTDSNMKVTTGAAGIYTVRVQYDGEGIFNDANVKVKVISPK